MKSYISDSSEALAAAKELGLALVTGECPTVGLAGGYTQGGGHSALSTSFGLAADNTLQFEVITADGQFVIASRTVNEDLYWALSGGGGGNYGVVYSLTVQAHPDAYIGGAIIDISSTGISNDTYYTAVEAFLSELSAIIDAGSMVLAVTASSVSLCPRSTTYRSLTVSVLSNRTSHGI